MTAHEHPRQNGRTSGESHSYESHSYDEPAWTAFLYSAGELSEDEATRFEARLESDASAQAALAQAVALSAGVKLAEESAPARCMLAPNTALGYDGFGQHDWGRHDWGRRVAGWMLLATAASVALWFAASQPRVEPGRETAHVPLGEAQRALAAAWASGQSSYEQSSYEQWESDDDLVIIDETMLDDELQAELDAHPVIGEPSAPDWLIAALVDQQTSPERGEN